MRNKRAKELRRAAERATVGKPGRRLANAGTRTTRGVWADCIVNIPTTTRAVYRSLKRAFYRGPR